MYDVAVVQVVDWISCWRRVPTVQTVQKTGKIPQVLFLDTVETRYDSAENCGISAVAVLSRWSMSLFMQFIDGCGRPYAYAVTLGLLLEVPQTQFIARVRGHSSCTAETGDFLLGWR